MVAAERLGISAALLTPFEADGSVNLPVFASHARGVLERGASSVTIFGTTGEGASLSAAERLDGLRYLLEEGVLQEQVLLAVYACAVSDAVQQINAAIKLGVTNFLLVPPFYYKGCSDDGLFAWHSELLRTVPRNANFVIYHIPQVTGVPLSFELTERLAKNFRDQLIGVKDSSGDWEYTSGLLASSTLPVLVGDERQLHRAAALGGAGTITGMANIYPDRMRSIFESGTEDSELSNQVSRILKHPVVPALKSLVARDTGRKSWERVRAPLEPLGVGSCL